MAKVPFSDVTPPDRKRTIRNIPIPNSGRKKASTVKQVNVEPVTTRVNSPLNDINPQTTSKPQTPKSSQGPYEYYYPRDKGADASISKDSRKKKLIFGGIALAAVAVFVVVMMTVFASATVLVMPKNQALEVSMNIIASVEPTATSSIRYEVIKMTRSENVSIPATGEKMAEVKASGKIVVYNNYSSDSQRLITRTRFKSPDGLIYRISESIVVPGKTSTGPGSIEVEVFADEPGEKYNIGKVDFTIPGFENDADRFKEFYARSATEMTGGFIGKRKTVSDSEKVSALESLDAKLQSLLLQDFQSKIPEGLVMITGGMIYESRELPQRDDSSSVIVAKEGSAYTMLFDKKELSDLVVNEYINNFEGWEGIKAIITDFSSLSVNGDLTEAKAGGEIEFSLSGNASIVAAINKEVLSQELSSLPRKDIGLVADKFPGISSIRATIRPIWKQAFPENPSKIKIETTMTQ